MADKIINNQHDFFKDVNVDKFNNVIAIKGKMVGSEKICKNQYDFFKSVKLDENGNLKVYK